MQNIGIIELLTLLCLGNSQYQGFLSAWEDFVSFSVTGGTEKNTRIWFASEDQ